MNSRFTNLLFLICLFALGSAWSDSTLAGPSTVPDTQTNLALEIQVLRENQRTLLSDLQARFEAALAPSDTQVLQDEIQRVKRGGELQLMTIQARHARALGRHAIAAEIERNILQLRNPDSLRSPLRPIDRIPGPDETSEVEGGRK